MSGSTMQYNIDMIFDLLFLFFGLGGIGLIGLVIVCLPFWLASWGLKLVAAAFWGLWHR